MVCHNHKCCRSSSIHIELHMLCTMHQEDKGIIFKLTFATYCLIDVRQYSKAHGIITRDHTFSTNCIRCPALLFVYKVRGFY